MTQKQMIELVQLHHPDIAPSVIRLWLNERRKRFAYQTGILRGYVEVSSVAGQKYYSIPSRVLDIIRVDVNGVRIDRAVPSPATGGDTTFDTPLAGE